MEIVWKQSEIPEGQLTHINFIYLQGKWEPLNLLQDRNDKNWDFGRFLDLMIWWRRGRRGDQVVEYYNSQQKEVMGIDIRMAATG